MLNFFNFIFPVLCVDRACAFVSCKRYILYHQRLLLTPYSVFVRFASFCLFPSSDFNHEPNDHFRIGLSAAADCATEKTVENADWVWQKVLAAEKKRRYSEQADRRRASSRV